MYSRDDSTKRYDVTNVLRGIFINNTTACEKKINKKSTPNKKVLTIDPRISIKMISDTKATKAT